MARVIVVGAGFGGVGLTALLLRDGHDVTVLERADGIGGTWAANTYPGAACDVPSHLYALSFAPNPDWSHVYAPQAEILAYIRRVADDFGVTPRVRTGAEVASATWDDAAATWTVELADGERLEADVLVPATGQLNRPLVPDVPGLDAFPGPVVHTARWDHDLDLDGVDVAVVGSGASAIQLVPRVAERAASLALYQRTPPWVLGRAGRSIPPAVRAAFRWVPGLRAAYRAGIHAWKEATWPTFLAGSVGNRALRWWLERRLRQRVADPGLRERLRPDFEPGCKRVLASDEWYEVLQRDTTTVVDGGLVRVDGDVLVGADGSRRRADVVLLGTGFRATEMLTPMTVTGRDGVDLHQRWADGASAHLGITVPGFPNLFVVYGPNTNLGHNSILLMLEAQFAHVRSALDRMRRHDLVAMEVREDAHDRFRATVDQQLERLVWDTGCTSWYLDGAGRNTNNWPGTVAAYRRAASRVDPRDYHLRRREPRSATAGVGP